MRFPDWARCWSRLAWSLVEPQTAAERSSRGAQRLHDTLARNQLLPERRQYLTRSNESPTLNKHLIMG